MSKRRNIGFRDLLDSGGVPQPPPSPPAQSRPDPSAAAAGNPALLYTLYLELDYIRPLVWRTITVPSSIRLDTLHDALQILMGWTNSHLHLHRIDNRIYGPPVAVRDLTDGAPEATTRLCDVLTELRTRFVYVYDLGSEWTVLLQLQKIGPLLPDAEPLVRCIDGQRTPPPEDIGFPPRHDDLVCALENPNSPDHAEAVELLGSFDIEAFDLDAMNQRLAKLKLSGPQGWGKRKR